MMSALVLNFSKIMFLVIRPLSLLLAAINLKSRSKMNALIRYPSSAHNFMVSKVWDTGQIMEQKEQLAFITKPH